MRLPSLHRSYATQCSKITHGPSAEHQRLFGLVLTGCYLAKGGLVDVADGDSEKRIALCRFAAENMLAETAALTDRVVTGASSLEAARIALA